MEHKCSMFVMEATGQKEWDVPVQGKQGFWITALLGLLGSSAFGEKFTLKKIFL